MSTPLFTEEDALRVRGAAKFAVEMSAGRANTKAVDALKDIANRLELASRSAPSEDGEPIGWTVRSRRTGEFLDTWFWPDHYNVSPEENARKRAAWCTDHWAEPFDVIPLYAHPSARAAEPHTHAELMAATKRLADEAEAYGDWVSGNYLREAIEKLARRFEPTPEAPSSDDVMCDECGAGIPTTPDATSSERLCAGSRATTR